MMLFVYDVETSGLPLFKEPSDDPRQPHIVQAAAALVDTETRATIASLDLIARPDGWEIPDDVAAVHGITTEKAAAVGIDERLIVDALVQMWRQADFRVGHNESFDARMLRIALKRFDGIQCPDEWKAADSECTAKLATPFCALPPTEKMKAAGRRHHKTPTLAEAYRHFFGHDFDGAHTALADVNACLAVYWATQDQRVAQTV